MSGIAIEAGGALAQAIQSAVQPKLIEYGWVADENDTTLSEYVTMQLVDGKDRAGVIAELGGEVLGVGEDDPSVAEFAEWLFARVQSLSAPTQQQQQHGEEQPQSHLNAQAEELAVQDAQMDDAATTTAEGVPSGPKAMRNGVGAGAGGRGRGQRMLGQLNNHLNRDQSLPDSLRRIKGAAGGQAGRINSHAGRDPPRGPKGQNIANGVQRMMNGGGRGGRGGGAGAGMGNSMMGQAGNLMGQMDPQSQMAMMQMMEMQTAMMQQMMQTGQMPPMMGGQQQTNGGKGGSLFDRVDKRNGLFNKNRQNQHQHQRNGDTTSAAGDSTTDSMDIEKKDPFSVPCRFNATCTNPTCPYAHSSPAAPPNNPIDLTDTCSFGAACENRKCAGRHPSPATRSQHLKQEVDCKFFPNCTNPSCPFKHPDMPLCRNGADCSVPNCKFTHSKIECRYNPCTKPFCPFKHKEGQRGVFKDKVWTSGAGDGVPTDVEGETTGHRFEGFSAGNGEAEELILPGQANGQGEEVVT